MIQLFRVTKEYGRFREALRGRDVHGSSAGEFVFLTGPSGAGKSTLLRLLFRDEPPSAGQIIVNGRNIGVLPPTPGAVFPPHDGRRLSGLQAHRRKTVFENIAFVQNVLGLAARPSKNGAPTTC